MWSTAKYMTASLAKTEDAATEATSDNRLNYSSCCKQSLGNILLVNAKNTRLETSIACISCDDTGRR